MGQNEQELNDVILRLNGRAWGIAAGLLLGGGLFLATVVLVLRGGPNAGQHLGLLRVFFPGYQVSLVGASIGFIYAFVVGYALGRLVGSVYNRLVASR
jgi:ABC-type nitrate/sulfonate/bicarbonate transport system permease component